MAHNTTATPEEGPSLPTAVSTGYEREAGDERKEQMQVSPQHLPQSLLGFYFMQTQPCRTIVYIHPTWIVSHFDFLKPSTLQCQPAMLSTHTRELSPVWCDRLAQIALVQDAQREMGSGVNGVLGQIYKWKLFGERLDVWVTRGYRRNEIFTIWAYSSQLQTQCLCTQWVSNKF